MKTTTPETEPYTLNIDLNVLNHLGLNLYSSVPAVLAELVANAWDADATRVDICIGSTPDKHKPTSILVRDNGTGMSDKELREKFLTVGYQRRQELNDDLTPVFTRKVMGRKGIGKLSAFSVARKVDIFSKRVGETPTAVHLDVDEIQRAIEEKRTYNPEAIDPTQAKFGSESGSELRLYSLNRRVVRSLDEHLAVRLSRRFSVQSEDFEVYFNGQLLEFRYSHIFPKIEYALTYGNVDSLPFECIDERLIERKQTLQTDEDAYELRGWIGLVSESGYLQDGDDNLNKISVLVRGKLGLENMLDMFREGGLYTKYIIGELEADFLDSTDCEDISTSSRQDFVQSDARIQNLRTFVAKELKYLKVERAKLKEQTGTQNALDIPAINAWYESLSNDGRIAARKVFGKISQVDLEPEQRKTLLKHGVLAFEHLRFQDKLSELANLSIDSLESVVQLFADLDHIEATWYHEITRGRLEIIEKLVVNIDNDVVEELIQRHLYDHLWLLDPSWDRATETPTLKKTVKAEFDSISDKLSEEEKRGRIDIRYKKTSGKHFIIELKRASKVVSDTDLMTQVEKYERALEKQLQAADEHGEIEVICLVGRKLKNWDTPEHKQKSVEALKAKNIRVVLYQSLIKDAELAYRAYIDKDVEREKIQNLLNAIDTA